jgi:hypothetical protein
VRGIYGGRVVWWPSTCSVVFRDGTFTDGTFANGTFADVTSADGTFADVTFKTTAALRYYQYR